MSDTCAPKWLNSACLGRLGPKDRLHRPKDILHSLQGVQHWLRSWSRWSDGAVALVDSTTSASDASLLALGADADVFMHTSLAHPTIVRSVQGAAHVAARHRRAPAEVRIVDMPGLRTRAVKDLAEEIVERIVVTTDGRPGVLVLEHVAYFDGLLIPVDRVIEKLRVRSPDLKVVLDGAQAVGLWQADASRFDGLIGCLHKVAAGPPSTGFLITTRAAAADLPYAVRAITELPDSLAMLPTVDADKWIAALQTLTTLDGTADLRARQTRVRAFNQRLEAALSPYEITLGQNAPDELRSHICAVRTPSADIACGVAQELAAHNFFVQQFGDVVRISAGLDVEPSWGDEVGSIIRRQLAMAG